jgi:hypothetical protein
MSIQHEKRCDCDNLLPADAGEGGNGTPENAGVYGCKILHYQINDDRIAKDRLKVAVVAAATLYSIAERADDEPLSLKLPGFAVIACMSAPDAPDVTMALIVFLN